MPIAAEPLRVERVPVRIFGIRIPFLAYDVSIADPAFAAILQMGAFGLGSYGTYEALKFAAFWRGVALISGSIATLPLRTYRDIPGNNPDGTDDERIRVDSFLDTTPSGPYGLTPFAWKELVTFNLVTQGECGLIHVYTAGGALCGFWPVNRAQYTVTRKGATRHYRVNMGNGLYEDHTDEDFTQIVGLSLDGVTGISPVALFQRAIQLASAQEIAAMRQATGGMKVAGLVSPGEEDITPEDAQAIQQDINAKMLGPDKAGSMIIVNKRLVFTKWDQTNVEAQFIELRRYAREEAALMLGLPIYMLEPSKQTSWGTGIEQQDLGMAKYTLGPITSRIEEAVSMALSPSTKFVEFDYKGFLQATPETEIKLLLQQYTAGVASFEEIRKILGFGAKNPDDTFLTPTPVSPLGKPAVEPTIAKPAMTETASNGTMAQ